MRVRRQGVQLFWRSGAEAGDLALGRVAVDAWYSMVDWRHSRRWMSALPGIW